MKARNTTVGKDRSAIECYLLAMPVGEVVTVKTISDALGIPNSKAQSIFSSLRMDGFAVNTKKGAGAGLWCASERARNPGALPKTYAPRRPLENGDEAYWSRMGANAMGTARNFGSEAA